MKFLTNIYDPKRNDAKDKIFTGLNETVDEAWDAQNRYLIGKIISKPQATKWHSSEKLEEMGMVGVYLP